jgi:hypothetical protein
VKCSASIAPEELKKGNVTNKNMLRARAPKMSAKFELLALYGGAVSGIIFFFIVY